MQMTQTLYEKFGGETGIGKLVDDFYERVLADDTVNHFFDKTDMKKQRLHQAHFLSFALGGPNQYTGRSMAKAHEGMNLQTEHYNAIVRHLGDALTAAGAGKEDIGEVVDRLETLKDDILHK